ncbi:MAG TPA: c-type cytochrome [Candidatus Eisenbacteria bacterium]|nr:c-type cytochrome [Candidatus Eisenbacteria bacterium]
MKRHLVLFAVLLVLGGCAKKSGDPSSSSGGTGTSVASTSKYDNGPRAAEEPIDESLVAQGEQLFQSKGCSACHGFGRRISCPDLQDVPLQRTSQWMEQQILHPEVMTKEDPISHQLFAQYSLQMPNQQLTQPEAHAVIEYIKHKNHEAHEGEGREHK